ncbi:hypothetical protein J4526_05605 [Desulfurococcaceae archaeon MEX13E-LK6-19]|nr:hypothetical protein J4526_05605 [Desulfurococcaceae archaeon MEX13E-LK6-19]
MTSIPLDKLEAWLPRIRWWPYPTAEGIKIHREWSEDDLVFIIIDYRGEKFYLPLSSGEPPEFLPSERIIHIDNTIFYEAEFSPKYLRVLDKSDHIEKRYYGTGEFTSTIKTVKPLTFETTNIVSLHEGLNKIVVKSYRRLSKENPEPLFLDLLTRKGYKYAPSLYAMYIWEGNPVSLAMEYIDGVGDGGKPFYDALLSMLKGRSKGMKIGLASLLGTEIADLHCVIAESNDPFFSPEKIVEEDVKKWERILYGMYKTAVKNLEELTSIQQFKYLEFWLEVFDKIAPRLAEIAVEGFSKQTGLNKLRIHNDLHLAQFIYNKERGFILTDFEGEPGRKPDERLLKLPVFRDIASMARSFQYLAFFALKDYLGLSIDELGRRLVSGSNDPTLPWRNVHLRALTASYVAGVARMSPVITGKNPVELLRLFNHYTLPWIIERGFYEVYYETSYGRDLIPVPITGLHEIYVFLTRKPKSLSYMPGKE